MTVILNALESQGNYQRALDAQSAHPRQRGSLYYGRPAGALRDWFLHQHGRGQWRAEPVSDYRTRERGCDLESDAANQRRQCRRHGYRAGGERSAPSIVASDLITNERKIETMVLANDGNIVVLGGLVSDEVLDDSQGVPVLSSIPLLGRLFRSDSVKVTKQNLLVFIRPSIIRNDEDLAGATAEKYRYIREQQMERRERGLMFLDDGNLPVLPTWEEQIQQLPEVPESATGEG